MEFLSVYNRFGEKTPGIIERGEAHRNGTLHRVFHLWIINSKNQILVQQRSAEKETGGNLWYVSVAGHIGSGESLEQGILREAQEEIGLDISPLANKINYLYSFYETRVYNNGGFIDNEFYDVFVLKCDFALEEMTMQESEVQALKYMDYSDFAGALQYENHDFVPHETCYKMLLTALDNYLK